MALAYSYSPRPHHTRRSSRKQSAAMSDDLFFGNFCFSCGNETVDGDAYCSEECRTLDAEANSPALPPLEASSSPISSATLSPSPYVSGKRMDADEDVANLALPPSIQPLANKRDSLQFNYDYNYAHTSPLTSPVLVPMSAKAAATITPNTPELISFRRRHKDEPASLSMARNSLVQSSPMVQRTSTAHPARTLPRHHLNCNRIDCPSSHHGQSARRTSEHKPKRPSASVLQRKSDSGEESTNHSAFADFLFSIHSSKSESPARATSQEMIRSRSGSPHFPSLLSNKSTNSLSSSSSSSPASKPRHNHSSSFGDALMRIRRPVAEIQIAPRANTDLPPKRQNSRISVFQSSSSSEDEVDPRGRAREPSNEEENRRGRSARQGQGALVRSRSPPRGRSTSSSGGSRSSTNARARKAAASTDMSRANSREMSKLRQEMHGSS